VIGYIVYALFFYLFFFVTLGIIHALDVIRVGNKEYRSAPVFPALLLAFSGIMMIAMIVIGIAGLIATAVEPTATTIRIQQSQNATAVVFTSKPNTSPIDFEPDWQYWVYALSAGLFPLGGYYLGYNLALWLEEKQTLPLLVRVPVFRFVVEEEVVPARPVEIAVRRKREDDYYVFPVTE